MPLPSFNPANPDKVLDALADPTLSLLDIARAHSTSVRALSAWLTSPDIRPHAEIIDQALASRARSQAAAALPPAIAAAAKAVNAFNQLQPPTTPDAAAAEAYRRHCLGALRAASLLLRFARFDGAAPHRHPPRTTGEPPTRHRRAAPPQDLSKLAALLAEALPEEAPRTITRPHAPPTNPNSKPALKPPPQASPALPAAIPAHDLPPILSLDELQIRPGPIKPPLSKSKQSPSSLAAKAGLTSGP